MDHVRIKIGRPPDYVLTRDKMTVFHRIHIQVNWMERNQVESIPISHRSLLVAMKQVYEILRGRMSVNHSSLFEKHIDSGYIKITDSGDFFSIRQNLPEGLSSNQEWHLRTKFIEYSEIFLESLKK